MNPKQKQHISKLLSLVLRHQPGEIGITLDANGWTNVDELLTRINEKGINLNFEELEEVVETNDKQRFAFNNDYTLIRASQGHSVAVDLQLVPQPAPDVLYHGTVQPFLSSIKEKGLLPGNRRHVHLSADVATATKVAARRGKPVILSVNCRAMQQQGHPFYQSANGVWLVDVVPVRFINF